MKGLLHRLAARAAGTAAPVRSDARLPFGGVNLAWGETDAAPKPLVMTPTAVARHPAQAHEAARPSTQRDGSEIVAPAPIRDRRLMPSPQLTLRTNLLPPVPQGARDDGPSASPTTSPAVPSAPVDQSDPMLSRLVEGRPPDAMQVTPIHAARSDRPARRPLEPPVPPPSPRPGAAMHSNEEPPLLVPRVATERVAAAVRGPIDPGHDDKGLPLRSRVPATAREPIGPNAGAPAADESTEVHIHIGRIEVTAAQEAPSPRNRPSRKQAPRMSLDAYLAARSKS